MTCSCPPLSSLHHPTCPEAPLDKTIGFWEYSAYPHFLFGVTGKPCLEETTTWIPSYMACFKLVEELEYAEGYALAVKLENLRTTYENKLSDLKDEMICEKKRTLTNRMLRWLEPHED